MPDGVIRPSMDRMRESVFASLGDLSGLSFLDVFSGSGIIALEAASRGAAYIEAVEQDKLKRKTLIANAGISPVRINLRFMSAELYFKRAKTRFDIIFLDPPFPYQWRKQLLSSIAASVAVSGGSKVLIHRPRGENLSQPDLPLTLEESREYGGSVVDFFRYEGEQPV